MLTINISSSCGNDIQCGVVYIFLNSSWFFQVQILSLKSICQDFAATWKGYWENLRLAEQNLTKQAALPCSQVTFIWNIFIRNLKLISDEILVAFCKRIMFCFVTHKWRCCLTDCLSELTSLWLLAGHTSSPLMFCCRVNE